MLRSASYRKEILQHANHVLRGEGTCCFKRQAFTSVLIDDNQEAKLTTIFGPIRHKVVRPDVILVFSTVADTAILTATRKTLLSMLFFRDLHVLSFPKSMDSLVIDSPVTLHQQIVNTLGSEPWPLPGQSPHLAK